MSLRARCLALALAPALALAGAASPALASDAVRVQADGTAPLPARVPGGPPPKPPDAAALRALRLAALANGVDAAVLAHARELAREDARDDEAALRAALGKLSDHALGQGVLADLGAREVEPKRKPGDPPPRPRKPSEPVPMERAFRIEVLVDGARVAAALRAAGLALTSGADGSIAVEVVLEAPYDAAGLAALRAQLTALGAVSAVPRRFEAAQAVLAVRGLPAEVVRQRVASQPPAGFRADTSIPEGRADEVRVRLTPVPPPAGSALPARAARRPV